jgi:DNA-binding transcriptional LysR family regulator
MLCKRDGALASNCGLPLWSTAIQLAMAEMRVTRKPRSALSTRLPGGIRHGNVELRHLRFFVVVAEELNLRRAVRRLEITQPGRLRIGLTDDAATLELTSILAAFHSGSPNFLVELVELSEAEVLPALEANTVDLVLASEPQDADGFAIEELWRESWSVVLPADHPLCHKSAVVPGDLAREGLALVRSSAQQTVLSRLCRVGKKSDWPHVAFRVADRRTAVMLARAGSAIAIAPSSSVLVAGLRAVMRPLLQDPGYAVIALKHDIDPPPGLVGRFLNVAREISGARSSKHQRGSPLPILSGAQCYAQHAGASA